MKLKSRSSIRVSTIHTGVHQIIINNHVYSYLALGQNKALLIDTGWGTVDLKSAVAEITSLPLIVINTHGHPDHAFGNYQFEQVYLMDEDRQLLIDDYNPVMRKGIIEKFGGDCLPETIGIEAWTALKPGLTLSLNNTRSIDLGGTVIEVIPTPGHTKGTVSLLSRSDRILFAGDTVIEGFILLNFDSSGGLKAYHDSILRLISYSEYYDIILPSHGTVPLSHDFLQRIEEALCSIITGKKDGIKSEMFNRSCLICDFDGFSVVYPESKVL